MNAAVQEDLIFDLGLHKGFDSQFYLKKGFRVVGLEAAPALCEIAADNLAEYGERMTIVNKALHFNPGTKVAFYTVPNKDDWGSLTKGTAEKGIETSVEIEVETIDLAYLLDTFGTPRYIKCDMEGGDLIFREQLLAETRRPTFVSTEMNDGLEGEFLEKCGYELGQIVNQWMNPFKKPPKPPREGSFAPAQFNGEMSGLFGRELDPRKWCPINETVDMYRRWKSLRDLDEDLAPGWVDLHACRREALG